MKKFLYILIGLVLIAALFYLHSNVFALSISGNKVSVNKWMSKVTLDKWSGQEQLTMAINQGTLVVDPTKDNDGINIDIKLDKKPSTNVFTYQMSGYSDMDFFYQAPLWQEQRLHSATSTCTDTDCVTRDGTEHRPDNIVGSYAVYSKTHANHILGQTNYETGKLFQIYRPLVRDAKGATVWATLNYNNGVLYITVPQSFLDNAVYPVIVDPTFGYTTIGGTQLAGLSNSSDKVCSLVGEYTATTNDFITSYSIYSTSTNASDTLIMGTYDVSSGNPTNLLGSNTSTIITLNPTAGWYSGTRGAYMTNGTIYSTCVGFGSLVGSASLNYDAGSAPGRFNSTSVAFTQPFAVTGTDNGRYYSMYTTYANAPGSPLTLTDNTTWTAPAGVTSVSVQCYGGGGGGAGTHADGSNSAGAGGGGGGYAKKLINVTAGNTYTVNIGAGGTAGAAGVTGTTAGMGGDSWFSTSGTILAKGGMGGTTMGSGGAGGASGSEIGDTVYSGGNGAAEAAFVSGGGGSSAGNASNGNSGSSSTGGTAPTGGGNGGNGGGGNNSSGSAGLMPGGGGGGGVTLNAALVGAAGSPGECILTWLVGNTYTSHSYLSIPPIAHIQISPNANVTLTNNN